MEVKTDKKDTVKNIVLWIVTLVPTVITAAAMRFMPDKVPLHYDINGNIDRWGSKYENFLFPAIIVVFTIFWICLIRYYKKKQQRAESEKEAQEAAGNAALLYYTAVGMALMFGIMQCVILFAAYGKSGQNAKAANIDTMAIINVLMGIFIIALGIMMPKSHKNATFGVRTVWSTDNDEAWKLSNQAGAIIMVIAGILTVAEALLFGGMLSTAIMLAIIIVAGILSVVCSYVAYKKTRG